MRKRILTLFIVMLFVLPTTLSFVTNPDGSNLQNETELVKEPELSYEEEPIKHLAVGGSVDTDLYIDGDYWDTWIDDSSYLYAYPINYTGIHLVFNITERLPLTEVSFFLRWQVTVTGPVDEGKPIYWMIYNFDTLSYETVYYETIGTSLSWEDREESITFDENYINSTNHVRFYAYGDNIDVTIIQVDYAYLTVIKGYDGEFRETLPDDLGYSPDSVSRSSFATGGDSDYENTYAVDGVFIISPLPLEFECQDFYEIEYFEYAVYGNSTGSSNMYYHDGVEAQEVFDTIDDTTLKWFNGTETDVSPLSSIASSGIFYVVISSVTTNNWVDYIEITFYYTIGLSEDIYAESFFDVSDWAFESDVGLEIGEYGFTTDSDVATMYAEPDAAGYEGVAYEVTLDTAISNNSYYEIRVKTTTALWYLYTSDSSDTETGHMTGGVATAWTTYKASLDNVIDIKKIRLKVYDYPATTATGTVTMELDYFRIGSANEMGWQHDGSTTAGYNNDGDVDKTYTYSSDGDILTFGVDHSEGSSSSYSRILPDTTPTDTDIERNYYPFIKARYRITTYGLGASGIALNWVSDGRRTTFENELTYLNNTWVEKELNAFIGTGASSSNYGFYVYYTGTEGSYIFDVDYVKAYSIANYTVSQSSTTLDDVLHVEVGVLNSTMDDGYFILEYDPAINFTGSYTWTKTTTSGESYLSFLHGGWTSYSNETEGTLYSGSTTGLRIKLNETANIQTIEFSVRQAQWVLIGTVIAYFDMPNWWLIATAEAIFYLPIGEFTISFMLMIMGLVMIPFSTLYLVIGGKDEMNRDKLYFFVLMFLIGWAFVLGGLM